MPDVKFFIGAASVPFVDGNESPVSRIVQEEAACTAYDDGLLKWAGKGEGLGGVLNCYCVSSRI